MQTGTAWLLFAIGIVLGAGSAPKLLPQVAPRYVAAFGALASAGAALWFSTISVETSYWTHLAPAMLVLALGFGLGVMALTQAAVYQVDSDKAGIASASLNSAQQIGVALGLAVLAGVAAAVTARPEYAAADAATAAVAGYSTALTVAAGLLLAAAALALATLRHGTADTNERSWPPRRRGDPGRVGDRTRRTAQAGSAALTQRRPRRTQMSDWCSASFLLGAVASTRRTWPSKSRLRVRARTRSGGAS